MDAKEQRYEALCSMNSLVRMINDEEAYYCRWINIVPDEATDEDLKSIAFDDDTRDFDIIVNMFIDIWDKYIKDSGIYIGDKVYSK